MKMKIALCDGDSRALPIIAGAAEATFLTHGVQSDIHRFQTGEALLKALEENRYHLVLLDIELPDMDGIDLVGQLRERNDDTKVVFVSNAESRVFESFLVQPLGFVRKSNFLNDLSAVVELYLKNHALEDTGDYLDFTTRTGSLTLKTRQILYIEGNRNYQLINVAGRSSPIEIKMTMEKLEKMTEPFGFIRIHKGFLVNCQYIQHLSYTAAMLQSGVKLPIGRSKVGEVKTKYRALTGK